ncbi:MAG: hypothetical protein LBH86_01520, partial [Oscillospiraceae bacterium]|nr:hypothetical protein [Oscillospiraceae bacterium]
MKNNAVTRVLFIFAAALFALLAYKNLCVLIDGTIPAIAEEMSVNGFLLTLFVVSAAFAGIFCLIIKCRRKPLIHGVPEKKGMKLLPYVSLFVIAYALRVLWITSIKTAQYSDYQIFYWVANTISSGGSGYTADPYFHTWAYQVGFPA